MADDVESFEKLKATQKLLKTSLEECAGVSSKLMRIGDGLEGMKRRLPRLEAEMRPMTMQKCGYFAMRDQISGAIGPAAAVLRVYDVVRELEKSVSFESCADSNLLGYISATKRLEESLRFLGSNCELAIQWLQDIVEFLEGNAFPSDRSFLNLKKALRILKELGRMGGCACVDGGVLNHAYNKLEAQFGILLMDIHDATTIRKVQAIVERLNAANRVEKCVFMYIEERGSNARRSLQAHDLDYLEMEISEFDDIKGIEFYIDKWGKDLEFVMKNLLHFEYELCSNVFEKIESDAWNQVFAKIAEEFRLVSFLRFGNGVTKMNKDPIKLLKLLDMFAVLENLRLDFNRLFGGNGCKEIQTLTRDLIKGVVNGACEIFWELPSQVVLQRRLISPPPDGGIPGLVSFITSYCNQILGEDYMPILIQVLQIHQSWKQDLYDDRLILNWIFTTMKEIGVNLDAWSKAYEDISLSYLFMMNNHCHFSKLSGTKLGDILGNAWIEAHEKYKDYYAALYLRESWGKLILLLLVTQKSLISFDKKRLKEFNEGFEERYKKNSNWVISDENLRHKICQLLVEAVVPVYKSYMKKYGVLAKEDATARKYVKHTAISLEKMLRSLFQPRVSNYGTTKGARFIGKLKNVVTNQLRVTLAAM